jgi:hypothetical protein
MTLAPLLYQSKFNYNDTNYHTAQAIPGQSVNDHVPGSVIDGHAHFANLQVVLWRVLRAVPAKHAIEQPEGSRLQVIHKPWPMFKPNKSLSPDILALQEKSNHDHERYSKRAQCYPAHYQPLYGVAMTID